MSPPPMMGSLSVLNEMNSSDRIARIPTAPITVGFFSRNGVTAGTSRRS